MGIPGRSFESPAKKQAVGFRKGHHVKLVTAFDPETFEEINAYAAKHKITTAEAIRRLVEWGLESA